MIRMAHSLRHRKTIISTIRILVSYIYYIICYNKWYMRLGWKILIIILALLAAAFSTQTGIYIYKIKTGKISPTYDGRFSAAKKTSGTSVINAAEIMNSRAPFFGSAAPELVIVEFGNFACPYSKEAAPAAREMMTKYRDKIKFIYRDYPLDDIYPNSSALSLAGKCAAEQNNIMFWAVHDKFYGAATPDTQLAASQMGLDKNKFLKCFEKQKYLADLNRDLYDGYKNGVAGTPTFFFIKKGLENKPLKVQGAIPKTAFQQIIDNLLK